MWNLSVIFRHLLPKYELWSSCIFKYHFNHILINHHITLYTTSAIILFCLLFRISVMDSGSLRITNVSKADAGIYTCVARNQFGVASSTGSLVVKGVYLLFDFCRWSLLQSTVMATHVQGPASFHFKLVDSFSFLFDTSAQHLYTCYVKLNLCLQSTHALIWDWWSSHSDYCHS